MNAFAPRGDGLVGRPPWRLGTNPVSLSVTCRHEAALRQRAQDTGEVNGVSAAFGDFGVSGGMGVVSLSLALASGSREAPVTRQ